MLLLREEFLRSVLCPSRYVAVRDSSLYLYALVVSANVESKHRLRFYDVIDYFLYTSFIREFEINR